jgi:hypothetical protein
MKKPEVVKRCEEVIGEGMDRIVNAMKDGGEQASSLAISLHRQA